MLKAFNSLSQFFFIGLVNVYQTVLSPFLGGNCRFYPSCSEYCKECFKKHDTFTSVKLSLLRLSKCYPLGPSGFDPVPENIKARKI